MITAQEAIKLAEELDISSYVESVSQSVEAAAKQGLRELILQNSPYNSMGSDYAPEAMKRLRRELLNHGYNVEHIPAETQMDIAETRITW